MRKAFIMWIPVATLATITAVLVYGAVQQNYRQSANDPQIQMAEDSAAALNNGQTIVQLVSPDKVDMAHSLKPFIIVYDQTGQIVQSQGLLGGQPPQLPPGVLAVAKARGEWRQTWQPAMDVREATVIVPYHDGYVLAARSLREVENRIDDIALKILLAWGFALAATLIASVFAVAVGQTLKGHK